LTLILCGIDDTPEARQLGRVAGGLAVRLGSHLALVHVAEAPVVPERPRSTQLERQREAEVFERAGFSKLVLDPIELPSGLAVEHIIEFGAPADGLLAVAERVGAELIVVGSRRIGALEKAIGGSTGAQVAAAAKCPVVLVPPADELGSGDSLLCGLDESGRAPAVAHTATQLAARLGLRLVFAHVDDGDGPLDDARLEAVAASVRAEPASLAIEEVPAAGSAADTLAALARANATEVIVVGSRGHGAVRTALLGSVSRRLVEVADRPVAVVPRSIGTEV
jgi:nucleotide-binding universal stress UspA family protein